MPPSRKDVAFPLQYAVMGPVGAREKGADLLSGLEVDLQIPEREPAGGWQGERGGRKVGEQGREGGERCDKTEREVERLRFEHIIIIIITIKKKPAAAA